jgi:hypothetical protein
MTPEGNKVGAIQEGRRKVNDLTAKKVGYPERQFFKLGPNGGIDPYVSRKYFVIRYPTKERKLSNVAGSTEGEDSVYYKCKLSKRFRRFVVVLVRIRRPDDASRDGAICEKQDSYSLTNSCFDWEKR